MIKKNLTYMALTVAAIFAVTVFAVLKIKFSSSCKFSQDIVQKTEKEDATVLPQSVGENPLALKSFYFSEEEFELSWDFLDSENLVVCETFPVDGFFSLHVKWSAKYSYNENENLLYIKRMALTGENLSEPLTGEFYIEDFLSDSFRSLMEIYFSSVKVSGDGDVKDLADKRICSYVDSRLYEIESLRIDARENGLLVENLDYSSSLFYTGLHFISDKTDLTVHLNQGVLLIENNPGEEKNHFYGGIVQAADEKLLAEIYEFVRDRETRQVEIIGSGKISATLEKTEDLVNFQRFVHTINIMESPDCFNLPENIQMQAKKAMYSNLFWMNLLGE